MDVLVRGPRLPRPSPTSARTRRGRQSNGSPLGAHELPQRAAFGRGRHDPAVEVFRDVVGPDAVEVGHRDPVAEDVGGGRVGALERDGGRCRRIRPERPGTRPDYTRCRGAAVAGPIDLIGDRLLCFHGDGAQERRLRGVDMETAGNGCACGWHRLG